MQNKVVCDLHGDHRREHRADQVQKARDVVHREEDGRRRADDRHGNGGLFAVELCGQALGRDARAPRIEEGRRDRGENQNDQRGNAEPGLDHDDGNVILAGKDGRAHADDVHPAGYRAVDQHADPGRLGRLLGVAGVVADERQPGQRHRHGQLHRRTEGQALAVNADHGVAGEEDDLAQHQRQNKQSSHRNFVDPAQIGHADGDPHDNQRTDDKAPDPAANRKNAADGQCTVIDHDGRPADELQNVQERKQQAALLAEAHFYGLHSAAARAPADEARQQHHGAADDMPEQNGRKALCHAQRRKGGAGQDLGQRDARAEPDQAVLKGRGLFHSTKSPFSANMWFIGPEPWPRSSIAASAPEMYAFARSTDVSRS